MVRLTFERIMLFLFLAAVFYLGPLRRPTCSKSSTEGCTTIALPRPRTEASWCSILNELSLLKVLLQRPVLRGAVLNHTCCSKWEPQWEATERLQCNGLPTPHQAAIVTLVHD